MNTTVLACLGITLAVGAPGAPHQQAITPVLEKEGVEYAYPHFSKNGGSILFQSNESGHWRLCTVSRSGGRPRPLTPDSINCYFPDWSPDNRRICFVSDRTGNEEVYLMNSDGSGERRLTANGARNIHPYWSPDGRAILFSSNLDGGEDLDVYRIEPKGSGLERLVGTPNEETCARMSPDGASVVLLANNEMGLDDLFLLGVADSSLVNLTDTPGLDGWPCWTPDGSKIVYSTVEDGVFKLFALDPARRSRERLTNPDPPYEDCRANVSADGKYVVFNRQHDSPAGRTNAILIVRL